MSVIDKLVRLLQDDYKVGVEMRSGKPLIYIDPDKIDTWRLERDVSKGDKDAISEQIATQLDEQYPGISKRFTQDELVEITAASLNKGPFSHQLQGGSPLCLINEPKGDQVDPDKIYDTFGLSKKFNPAHLIPLPGSRDEWEQLVGEHEGEHCNQTPVQRGSDPLAEVKILGNEALSDRAALESLRKQGRDDIAQAWKDIRVFAAANGDDEHATSIFLDDPNFEGAKPEHLEAARAFRNEMCLGVAQTMGITPDEAEKLRKADPQKFADTVEDAYINGNLPALRDMDEAGIQKRIAAEMGLSDEEFGKLKGDRVSEISETYKKLKTEGALKDYGPDNPHIDTYIGQYVDATRRMFVEDTTPAADAAPAPPEEPPKPASPPPPEPTPEERAAAKETELRKDADIYAGGTMDEVVGKSLHLSEEKVGDLYAKDPDRYHDTVEQAIQKGGLTLQTDRFLQKDERDALIAKKLGVPVEEIAAQPQFLQKMANDSLVKEGAFWVKQDNPYLKEAMEGKIKEYREEKLKSELENTNEEPESSPENIEVSPPEAPAASPSATPPAAPPTTPPASTPATAPAAARGSYDYLSETRPDTGGGVPQIDLRSSDRGQMRIGSLSASEYFALQADPALAQQQLSQQTALPTPDIEQKVALQQPKAQPAQSYAPA
ncbi:MAG: hypothetical protein WC043_01615 [Pseudobdellovibrionaceae bacterium]